MDVKDQNKNSDDKTPVTSHGFIEVHPVKKKELVVLTIGLCVAVFLLSIDRTIVAVVSDLTKQA